MQARPYYACRRADQKIYLIFELISIAQDPVLLSIAKDYISSEQTLPQQTGALGEVAEP